MQPVEIASQGQIEALAHSIQSTYPELAMRLGEDDNGPYIDVLYGDEEWQCETVRCVEDWQNVLRSQRRLGKVLEYGANAEQPWMVQ